MRGDASRGFEAKQRLRLNDRFANRVESEDEQNDCPDDCKDSHDDCGYGVGDTHQWPGYKVV
jgi:hypothetical protein